MGSFKDANNIASGFPYVCEPPAKRSLTPGAAWMSLGASYEAGSGPRSGIARVPTHAVTPKPERRAYIRARLALPLRVERVAGQRDSESQFLRTRDISSSGVFFNYPQALEPGTPIEFEVLLVDRPRGCGSVRMRTLAHVVRAERVQEGGWHGLAATFDDISFVRDDQISHC
jgi:hypothetical protein